jgi:hypothetical protein
LLAELDSIARDYDNYDYGLPMAIDSDEYRKMREKVAAYASEGRTSEAYAHHVRDAYKDGCACKMCELVRELLADRGQEDAQEFLASRGLADLSLYWPTGKPIPQIDYESGEAQPTLIQLMAEFASQAGPDRTTPERCPCKVRGKDGTFEHDEIVATFRHPNGDTFVSCANHVDGYGDGHSMDDPIRIITQYWTLEGELLAEVDPCVEGKASDSEKPL